MGKQRGRKAECIYIDVHTNCSGRRAGLETGAPQVAVNRDHNTTGKNPAELLFNTKVRRKLPDLIKSRNGQEIRDCDAEQKGRAKLYADGRDSQLEVGDQILVRQEKTEKLKKTAFNQVPYTVVSIKGNSVTTEDSGGTKYKRNTTFEKKFFSENANDDPVEQQNQSETEPVKSGTENTEQMISDKMQPRLSH